MELLFRKMSFILTSFIWTSTIIYQWCDKAMSFLVLKVLAFISSETVFEKSENQATLWIKHVNQK